MKNNLRLLIKNSIVLKRKLIKFENKISNIINLIFNTIKNGNKVFICGNGGSAADAQHLAAEFLIRLKPKINRRPYPVISLAQDTSTLTACGNDIGFDNIFSRNLEGISTFGDLLIVLSTSGNSKNILKVLNKAVKLKIKSVSFLGCKGGKAKGRADLEIVIPSNNTARIQESHIFLGHLIFERVEQMLLKYENKTSNKG